VMADWKRTANRLAAQLEEQFDAARVAMRDADGLVEIHPFRGYGTESTLHVLGRVLRQPRIALAADAGTAWSNLLETYRRLRSEEVPAARVVAEIGAVTADAQTDGEGYFHIEMKNPAAPLPVQRVRVRATDPLSREPAVAEVVVPGPDARFGVISDIDDTIVETNATGLLKMARTVFMQNARGRVAAPGVAAFFRALHDGVNPFFFVSSSPWNFFDLLDQFLTLHSIPAGPLMLQDYGIDEAKLIYRPHDDHKLEQIEEILGTYATLPFVLIGDSGQRDPEIYRTVAGKLADRIRAIYIRDVSPPERDEQVRAIAAELSSARIPVALITKWEEAAAHARANGLLLRS
jgi:phosphatidate phosphatase APP1